MNIILFGFTIIVWGFYSLPACASYQADSGFGPHARSSSFTPTRPDSPGFVPRTSPLAEVPTRTDERPPRLILAERKAQHTAVAVERTPRQDRYIDPFDSASSDEIEEAYFMDQERSRAKATRGLVSDADLLKDKHPQAFKPPHDTRVDVANQDSSSDEDNRYGQELMRRLSQERLLTQTPQRSCCSECTNCCKLTCMIVASLGGAALSAGVIWFLVHFGVILALH
jgi:hypothetical protein